MSCNLEHLNFIHKVQDAILATWHLWLVWIYFWWLIIAEVIWLKCLLSKVAHSHRWCHTVRSCSLSHIYITACGLCRSWWSEITETSGTAWLWWWSAATCRSCRVCPLQKFCSLCDESILSSAKERSNFSFTWIREQLLYESRSSEKSGLWRLHLISFALVVLDIDRVSTRLEETEPRIEQIWIN